MTLLAHTNKFLNIKNLANFGKYSIIYAAHNGQQSLWNVCANKHKFERYKLFVYGLKSDASKNLESCEPCTVDSVVRVEHIQERGYQLIRGQSTESEVNTKA